MSDSVLLFTSKRNSKTDGLNRIEKEDLFVTRLENNEWGNAELLEPTLSKFKEGSGFMTKDGKTIYFTRCGAPDGLGNCDLYFTEYFGGEEEYDSLMWSGISIKQIMWCTRP